MLLSTTIEDLVHMFTSYGIQHACNVVLRVLLILIWLQVVEIVSKLLDAIIRITLNHNPYTTTKSAGY